MKLQYDELVSNFAFKFNSGRYRTVEHAEPGGCCGLAAGKKVTAEEPFERVDVAPSRGWGFGEHNDGVSGAWRGVELHADTGLVRWCRFNR
jgi:hypothetical protein